MLHPSTKKLVDRLSEMTAQRKVAWTEGDNGAIQFETEGYRVVVHADPQSLTLETVSGKVMEEVSAEQLAETPCEDGGTYQTVVSDMVQEASRTARGTETAIERLLSSLDRALEPSESASPVVAAAADPALTGEGVADTAPDLDEDPVEETGAVTAEIRPEGALASDTDDLSADDSASPDPVAETTPDVTPEPVAAETVDADPQDTLTTYMDATPEPETGEPFAPAEAEAGARLDLAADEETAVSTQTESDHTAVSSDLADLDPADETDTSPLSEGVAEMDGPVTGFAPDSEPLVTETADETPSPTLGFAGAPGLGAPPKLEAEPDEDTGIAVEAAAVEAPAMADAAPLSDTPDDLAAEPAADEPVISPSHASPWAAANPAFGAPAVSPEADPAPPPQDQSVQETSDPVEADAFGEQESRPDEAADPDGAEDDAPEERPAPATRFNPWN